jgi:DNA-binding IclR family transcriptional regulator
MHKPPVGLTSINFSRPRQKEVIALIRERPRTKAELIELMKVKKGNLEKVLQTLISKGEIVPNPETGKYEIYPKSKKSAAEEFAAVEIEASA